MGIVRDLDDLRLDDPESARDRAIAQLQRRPQEIPDLLGVIGSCYRATGELQLAAKSIWTGVESAGESKDLAALGRLYRRLGYVYLSDGDPSFGLELCCRGLGFLGRACEFDDLARASFDVGMMQHHMGSIDDSIKTLEITGRLAVDDTLLLFSLHQLRAFNAYVQGDLIEAEEEAQISFKYPVPDSLLLDARWFRANLLKSRGLYEQAESELITVCEELRPKHFKLAFASCDFVETLLLAGKKTEACQASKSMAALLQPFRKNKLACAAISQLIGHSLETRLDLEKLQIGRKKIWHATRKQRALTDFNQTDLGHR